MMINHDYIQLTKNSVIIIEKISLNAQFTNKYIYLNFLFYFFDRFTVSLNLFLLIMFVNRGYFKCVIIFNYAVDL